MVVSVNLDMPFRHRRHPEPARRGLCDRHRGGLFFIDKKSLTPQMERLQKQVFKDTQFPPLRILHQQSLNPDLGILQAGWKVLILPPSLGASADNARRGE